MQAGQTSITQAMMQMQQAMMEKQMTLMGNMLQNVLLTVQQKPQAPPVASMAQPQAPPVQVQQAPQAGTTAPTQAPVMRNLVSSAAQQGSGTSANFHSFPPNGNADFNCGDAARAPFLRPPEPMPFKGEIQDWPRFDEEWKYYCTQMLPDDIQKMRLLKRLLEGPAKNMSAYYRDTSKDYYDLMQALSERYNQPGAVLNYLNSKLGSIACPRRETAQDLRDFYDKLDAVCRQLKSAGCDTNHRLYLNMIVGKLPDGLMSTVIDAEPLTPPVEWNTDKVMSIIRGQVLKAENIQRAKAGYLAGQQPEHQNKLDPHQNKLDHNHGRRVYAVQHADLEEEEDEDHPTAVSEATSNKMDPSLAVKVESGGTLIYNTFKGTPDETHWATSGRVPPKGRHNSDRPKRRSCTLCSSSEHQGSKCSKYTTFEERRARLKELKRCLRCTRQGETKLADCPFKSYTCQDCGSKSHHPVLCPKNCKGKPNSHKIDSKPDGHKLNKKQDLPFVAMLSAEELRLAAAAKAYANLEWENSSEVGTNYGDDYDEQMTHMVNTVMSADHHVMQALSEEQTLLMTTELNAFNPQDPAQQCSCPVFFDQGSTNTLITRDLARKLNLPIKEEKVVTFHSAFGNSADGRQVPCWSVNLELRSNDKTTLKVAADAVDTLCAPMKAMVPCPTAIQRVIRKPHSPLPTAVIKPQILIGTDYFGDFDIIRRKKKLANGSFVYDSLVGPLLTGKGKVTWKNDTQARPVPGDSGESRQQDPHKLDIVEQAQPSNLEERRPTLLEIRRAISQIDLDRLPEVGGFVLVPGNEPGPLWQFARVSALDRDIYGIARNVRLKFKGGVEGKREMHQVIPFDLKMLDSKNKAANKAE